MLSKKLGRWIMAVVALGFAEVAVAAGPKTLIEMNGAAPTPGLASQWKKVKEGEYQFTLDPSKEVSKGTPVSAAAVKSSLEGKLGAEMGVKVTDKGGNVVAVTYTGDEKAFLGQVAKTKIRGGDAELALNSATSEGAIRANPGARKPNDGEVKALVMKIQPGILTVKVNESKAKTVATGATVKLKADGAGLKTTQTVFFVPETKEGDVWVPKAGSFKDK